jgi:hypothetical protein
MIINYENILTFIFLSQKKVLYLLYNLKQTNNMVAQIKSRIANFILNNLDAGKSMTADELEKAVNKLYNETYNKKNKK